MKIALAALHSDVNDVECNIERIAAVMQGQEGRSDLVVLPEAYLQGFGAITDDPVLDLARLISFDDPVLDTVTMLCKQHSIAICLPFFEREGNSLHSSAVVIDAAGRQVALYRRMSSGWRHPDANPGIYVEGGSPYAFRT